MTSSVIVGTVFKFISAMYIFFFSFFFFLFENFFRSWTLAGKYERDDDKVDSKGYANKLKGARVWDASRAVYSRESQWDDQGCCHQSSCIHEADEMMGSITFTAEVVCIVYLECVVILSEHAVLFRAFTVFHKIGKGSRA